MESGGHVPYQEKTGWLGRGMISANYIGKGLALALPMPLLLRGVPLNNNFEREKGSLISYIGHEFKTPLTNCIGFIQLLKHSKNDEQKKKYISLKRINT